MECNYIRASTWNTFSNCQWQYFLNYYCNLPSIGSSKMSIGTIVHHVLEILAKVKKNNHHLLKDKYSDYKYLLNIVFKRHKLGPTEYKQCQKSIEKVLNSPFNPLKLKILKTEDQFEVDIKKPGFYNKSLRGTIDLIVEESPTTLHIIDYKTGKYKSEWSSLKDKVTEEDFKNDMQLQVYDLVCSVLYPQYKYIMLTLIYINVDGPTTISFEKQERKAFIETLRKRFLEIEQCEKPKRILDDPLRKDHRFKCWYVCQFGKYEVFYKNIDNKEIVKLHSYKELKTLPTEILENGEVYFLSDKPIYSLCNKYHYIFKKTGDLEKTKEKIVQLTLNNKDVEISRRNDYSHGKLHRGVLE